jgi:hypothetical protein
MSAVRIGLALLGLLSLADALGLLLVPAFRRAAAARG